MGRQLPTPMLKWPQKKYFSLVSSHQIQISEYSETLAKFQVIQRKKNKEELTFTNISSGVDLAHVINGYRYHTKYDHIKFIPKSVLQHTGDNILALTKLIANSEELSNTEVSKTYSSIVQRVDCP